VHAWIGLALTFIANLIIIGIFIGWVRTKINDHGDKIESMELDLRSRMNRETMELRFSEITRRFDALDKRFDTVEKHIEDAGCEYPKCVVGQLLSSGGATPADIVRFIDLIRKEGNK